MVSEPAGIPTVPTQHAADQDTGTQDEHIADSGREQARDHNDAKPDQPGKNHAPRFGSIDKAVHTRAQSNMKPCSA